ncbi:hypothetical protein [Glutamicibacter sp.]|uniref:hypothetical protein n=1 Tax=Glutamicibacter sp. TaxID=1931995 RepID=UPI002B4A2A47|nr:hypothetical protein [Glutamicibacter sp.]HJX77317.1 hypothetical protein [Glutamicibacter sp.]
MSGHKISVSGLSIECHEAPDADCRKRPNCEPEEWDTAGCRDHSGEHKLTTGHDCWLSEWVNGSGLEDSYYDFDKYPITPTPNAPVELINEHPDAVLWKYEEIPNA